MYQDVCIPRANIRSSLTEIQIPLRHVNVEITCSFFSTYLSVYLSVCLSLYLSVYLSLYLSISLSICLSLYLSICLSVYLLSVYLSIYLSICLPVYLSVCLSVYLSICLSVYLSICLSVCLSVCLSIYLSVYLYIYLSLGRNRFEINKDALWCIWQIYSPQVFVFQSVNPMFKCSSGAQPLLMQLGCHASHGDPPATARSAGGSFGISSIGNLWESMCMNCNCLG